MLGKNLPGGHCILLQITSSVSVFFSAVVFMNKEAHVIPFLQTNYICFYVKVCLALCLNILPFLFLKTLTQTILIWCFILWYFSGRSLELSSVSVARCPFYPLCISQPGTQKDRYETLLFAKHFKFCPVILPNTLRFWPILEHISTKKSHPQDSTESLKRIKWDLYDKLQFLRSESISSYVFKYIVINLHSTL